MRINKINDSNFRHIKRGKLNQHATNSINSVESKDSFQKINSLNFTAYDYDIRQKYRKITIKNFTLSLPWDWDVGTISHQRFAKASNKFYEKRDCELREIAKELCLYTNDDIDEFCRVWKKVLGFRFEKPELSELNRERITPFIYEARSEISKYLNVIIENDILRANNGVNMASRKSKISKALLEPISVGQDVMGMKDMPIANGIIIYGDANKQKDELEEWLKSSKDLRVVEIEYDEQNPQKSIDEFKKELSVSKKINQNGGLRTLIDVSSFDTLLLNYETPQARRIIAQFKNISELASKEYNTTLFMKTKEETLRNFEPASIGLQRFDIQIETNKTDTYNYPSIRFMDAVDSLQDWLQMGLDAEKKYTEETRLDYAEVEKLQD